MFRIIIEDEGAYHFCRKGRFANEDVSWHVTSPWLLERLQKLNEKVESLEMNISLAQMEKLGHTSIQFGDLLSKTLDHFIDLSPNNYFLGRTLRHRIQFICFTLFYKSALLNEWCKNNEKKGKLVVVGNKHLKSVTNFDILFGRFENLFSSIVDASKVNMIEIIHYIQKDGQDISNQISRKNNISLHEKLLYIINTYPLSNIIEKSLNKIFNYNNALDSNSLILSNNHNINQNIVVLKRCPLLDESIGYFSRKNTKIYFRGNYFESIKSLPVELSFSINDLKIEIQNIIKRIELKIDPFLTGSIDIFSNRLYKAIKYGCGLSHNLDEIYSKFSEDIPKKFAIATNGLTTPTQRLFQQCLIKKEIPIFSFEHGVTTGICGVQTPYFFSKGLYTDGGDFLICYNSFSLKAMNSNRNQIDGVIAGAPETNKKIKYRGIQKFISRKYIKAKNNDRVIFYLGLISRNNIMEPPFQVNDLEYHNITKKMIFGVLAKIKDNCILKLYPSNRYLDPDPWIKLIKLPKNVQAIQYFEYSELRTAADVTILSSSQSTFGWVWSTSKPIIFLELPSKPLMKNVVHLFDRALFRIDGSKKYWQEEIIEILKMPHKKLLKLWENKKDAQKELETHIFGPKGNSGKRAADYIAGEIREHYS